MKQKYNTASNGNIYVSWCFSHGKFQLILFKNCVYMLFCCIKKVVENGYKLYYIIKN